MYPWTKIECDPHAPFAGAPHEHMTAADAERARSRPYPEGFTAHANFLREYGERRAGEKIEHVSYDDERRERAAALAAAKPKKAVRRARRA